MQILSEVPHIDHLEQDEKKIKASKSKNKKTFEIVRLKWSVTTTLTKFKVMETKQIEHLEIKILKLKQKKGAGGMTSKGL